LSVAQSFLLVRILFIVPARSRGLGYVVEGLASAKRGFVVNLARCEEVGRMEIERMEGEGREGRR
jgi:hypothetical protein